MKSRHTRARACMLAPTHMCACSHLPPPPLQPHTPEPFVALEASRALEFVAIRSDLGHAGEDRAEFEADAVRSFVSGWGCHCSYLHPQPHRSLALGNCTEPVSCLALGDCTELASILALGDCVEIGGDAVCSCMSVWGFKDEGFATCSLFWGRSLAGAGLTVNTRQPLS